MYCRVIPGPWSTGFSSATAFAGTYGSFVEFNILTAATIERVYLWSYAYTLVWPFLMALQLHCVLAFTERWEQLPKRAAMLAIYVPSAIIAVLGQVSDEFIRMPVQTYGGWALLGPKTTPLMMGVNTWVVVMGVLPVVLVILYIRSQTEERRRIQASSMSQSDCR